jgi:hypothetical protein
MRVCLSALARRGSAWTSHQKSIYAGIGEEVSVAGYRRVDGLSPSARVRAWLGRGCGDAPHDTKCYDAR